MIADMVGMLYPLPQRHPLAPQTCLENFPLFGFPTSPKGAAFCKRPEDSDHAGVREERLAFGSAARDRRSWEIVPPWVREGGEEVDLRSRAGHHDWQHAGSLRRVRGPYRCAGSSGGRVRRLWRAGHGYPWSPQGNLSTSISSFRRTLPSACCLRARPRLFDSRRTP